VGGLPVAARVVDLTGMGLQSHRGNPGPRRTPAVSALGVTGDGKFYLPPTQHLRHCPKLLLLLLLQNRVGFSDGN